ncbi:MAG TPA: hypothetical protein VHM90_20205, partial [Phycisphaerae bacterium]|nr:hypothetical protein [Phycisphaerae bacterium]
GFSPLLESNWWQLPSLIIFMQNAIVQTRERHFIGMPEIVAAGNPARLWGTGTGTEKARVTTPDGTVVEVGARDGAAEFGMTDKVGFYDVGWKGGEAEKKATIAVNLLSPVESDIRPQPLQTREGGSKVEQLESVARQNKEIWKWLAAAGLAVLLVEWWAYHRRIG